MNTGDSSDKLNCLGEWFRAFSTGHRLRIVQTLATGAKTVTEIGKETNIEIVNVSHHLSILRTAKVVAFAKVGRSSAYFLKEAVIVGNEVILREPESGVAISIPRLAAKDLRFVEASIPQLKVE